MRADTGSACWTIQGHECTNCVNSEISKANTNVSFFSTISYMGKKNESWLWCMWKDVSIEITNHKAQIKTPSNSKIGKWAKGWNLQVTWMQSSVWNATVVQNRHRCGKSSLDCKLCVIYRAWRALWEDASMSDWFPKRVTLNYQGSVYCWKFWKSTKNMIVHEEEC